MIYTRPSKLLLALAVIVLPPLLAFGGPGEGIRVGKLTISPFINASVTYDSNVFLEEKDPNDDFFLDTMIGVSVAEQVRTITLNARAWYMLRKYLEYTSENHDEWGESASIAIGSSERTLLQISQRFRRTEDFERTPGSVEYANPENQTLILSEDRTMRVPRSLNDVGVSISRKISEKTTILASGALNYNNYDSSSLYDWNEDTILAQVFRRITDKTSATLSGTYGLQHSDGLDEAVRLYSVDAGLQMRRSAKLHLDASLGVQRYEAPAETGPENPTFLAFNAAARWAATKKWTLQLSSRNGMQPASQFRNDTMKVTLVSLSAERPLGQSLLFSMTGAYRYDMYNNTRSSGDPTSPEYTGAVQDDATSGEAWSRQWAGLVRLDYRPNRKPYNVYAEVRYEDTDSVWFKYDQLRASIGLAARY